MIRPSKVSTLGNVKTCKVHDIAVSISRTENHVFIVDQHTSTTAATQQGIRHLSYFAEKKLNPGLVLSGVRSLTLFNGNSVPLASFKMLRVLDLRYGAFRKWKQDINIIGSLVHLKYLHFPSDTFISALPKSIGNLKGLQTLELELSASGVLPTEITKLQNLRCPYYRGFDLPEGMRRLEDLQVLELVNIRGSSGNALKELGELTQLRKLSVLGLLDVSEEKCQIFSVALSKLSTLRSLNVIAIPRTGSGIMNRLITISSPLPFLERLMLDGYLEKIPAWISQSMNLIKIILRQVNVMEAEAFAELPNLMHLGFSMCTHSERIVFRSRHFQS
jgi:disease resistance protein RPM1